MPIALLGVLACGLAGYASARTGGLPAGQPAVTTAPETAVVSITARGFEPETVTVRRGGSVTWVNEDDREHIVQAADGSFESPRLLPGQRFSRSFPAAGRVEVVCPIHPRERGVVVVEP